MKCVKSPTFFFLVYLFCTVMEFFSAMVYEVADSEFVPIFNIRGGLSISHLCFADDVMIFAKATMFPARRITNLLVNFRDLTAIN